MALPITSNLKNKISQPEFTPVLVGKIDGYDTLLTNLVIKKIIRIGDPGLLIGGGWKIGGFTDVENQAPLISFDQGTTTKITQKLDQSKGLGSSVSQMNLALLDYNAVVTNLVSPGQVLTDIIGRRMVIFKGAQETSWPRDFNVMFRGVIQEIDAKANIVTLALNNTEEKKRVSLLPRISTDIAIDVNYRSVTFQDIQFKNREDIVNLVTVNYNPGGTAGSEVVTVSGGYTINVQIQDSISTAAQIKKAIENNSSANQLVTMKVVGSGSNVQTIGSASLGTDTTINAVDASEFVLPGDTLETFLVCENELMNYTGISGNQFTGLTRSINDSEAAFHAAEKQVEQVVKITDNAIDIALKLMLSKGPEFYIENMTVNSIEYYSPSVIVDDAIYFEGINLETDYGVSIGDKVTVTLSGIGPNNVIDSIIVEVGETNSGSYIIVSDSLVQENTTTAVCSFKSQFNTLPIGFGMLPNEVDVKQHQYIKQTYLPVAPMSVIFRDVNDGKGFLEKQVYMPISCSSVPRKGRSSIVYTTGPLPTYNVVTLDTTTVQNPELLSVKRSQNENFFNQVQFSYDYDPVSGKYLTQKNYPPEPDRTQIDVGAKPYVIQSQGLTTANGAEVTAEKAAEKYLNRFSKGAEFIKGIKLQFSVGYEVEIGDVVAVDYESLKLSDFSSGTRAGPMKLMEVSNKSEDNKNCEITIDVVNTSFGVGDRFGLISPSSKVGTGSTTTKVIVQKSWSTESYQRESAKWADYIDQDIIIHNEDWSVVYSTVLRGFDNNNPQGFSVDALPSAPGQGWIIQCPDYPNSINTKDLAFWKNRHAFFSPRVSVASGVSTTELTVAPGDIGKFFVGSIIRVHSYDFSTDSGDVKVTDITSYNITVNKTMGFIPDSTMFIDLIGFPDKQQSYRVM